MAAILGQLLQQQVVQIEDQFDLFGSPAFHTLILQVRARTNTWAVKVRLRFSGCDF